MFTTVCVVAVCISALTGPIYYASAEPDGSLRTWGSFSKVAVFLIFGGSLALYMSLVYLLTAALQATRG